MTETRLWVDNTEPLYRRKLFMQCNLYLKKTKGTFNPVLAKKLFRHLTTAANQDYKKSIGEALPIPDRREAEAEFVQEFQEIVSDPGETKFLKEWCSSPTGGGRREKAFRT